ncbi:MAG TPA: hypothetical protein VGH46_11715 [Gaiellaceae bacterium]
MLDYATAGVRVAERSLVQRPRLGREERLVFVVGCPRSGTTFVGRAIGGLPGFVDFGEVTPWKAALPTDPSAMDLRRILERIRRLGLAWGLRGVEQTPETAHVLAAALEAYPQALAVHALRDGRDVVCSLLERGWLNADQAGKDDAGLPYGAEPRFWVEPERRDEFAQVSDARRCAWAWRRYVQAVRAADAGDRLLEIRYEELAGVADRLAGFLGANVTSTHKALDSFRDSSIGRWRRDLSSEQVADVEAEAGALLSELGYA